LTDFINDIAFPIVLFIAYLIAASFVVMEIDSEPSEGEEEITTAYAIDPHTLDREWLQTRSLKDLKAIASQLDIMPTGNKSYRSTWIEAIISTELDLTILPLA
jgi:hypothetical protein